MTILTNGPWFCDEHGRALLFHGVNVSGSSKVPTRPDGATHRKEGFFNHRDVSFAGRPFPLEEADEHFTRLRAWGLTFLRFLVTWEAIEHSGPGIYDEEYLDYLQAIIGRAGEYGFTVLIDPHQDVWSRFSGGDGAPGWTLEAVGFDLTQFHETGAAIVHQLHGDPFPQMVWPTNGSRLAAATMFTLFFGGNDFAPATLIEGEPAQEYLQRHYINAFRQVARRLKDMPHVIAFEPMNEPMTGFIGCKDLTRPLFPYKFGAQLSPIQSMMLGEGIPQEIEIWERRLFSTRMIDRVMMNPRRLRIWREGYDGVWCQNNVWRLDEQNRVRLTDPHHFWKVNGREINFSLDYMRPFINRFAAGVRAENPNLMIFVETDPLHAPPDWTEQDADRIVYAPHWYDPVVLFLKTYSPWVGFNAMTNRLVLGRGRVRRSNASQMLTYKKYAVEHMGRIPTLIGETGIAFDLNHRRAYKTGDFRVQEQAMARTLRAMDDTLLSYTLWNYTPDNDHARGDQWNGEDLSIFSRDDQKDPADIHSGGRALKAVVRPYPRATAGEPLKIAFDEKKRVFEFEFRHDPTVQAPTEIFVPNYQFPNGYDVWVTDGELDLRFKDQLLLYRPNPGRQVHKIRISPR